MSTQGSYVGKVIDDRYRVLEKIGQGGFGEVYKAQHIRMDRTVALKMLRTHLAGEEEHLKRFEHEAKAASRINHPNAVVIHDFGAVDEGSYYIAMELIQGVSLKQVMKESGPLPATRVVKITKQICSVLSEAHRMGVVHRDIKPENIMLCEKGRETDFVKVLDFGIAKIVSGEGAAALTQTGVAFGTPRYMSPEQCEGKPVDWRADIYALGCIIFEMIAGKPPFEGEVTTVMYKHVREEPPALREMAPPGSVTEELERVVRQALEKQRELRQPAESLAVDLQNAVTVKTPRVVAQPPALPPPPLPQLAVASASPVTAATLHVPTKSKTPLVLAGAFFAAVILGTGFYLYTRWREPGPDSTQSQQSDPDATTGAEPTRSEGATQGATTAPITATEPKEIVPEYQRLSEEAVIQAGRGSPEQAIQLLSRAIQMKPDAAELHYNLAQVFIMQNRYREAIAEMRLYLQQNPSASDRAAVEAKISELDRALAAYENTQ